MERRYENGNLVRVCVRRSRGKNTMPAQDKAKKEALRKELEKMSVHFVQDDYTRFLKQEYPVKINERNYEKFIAK